MKLFNYLQLLINHRLILMCSKCVAALKTWASVSHHSGSVLHLTGLHGASAVPRIPKLLTAPPCAGEMGHEPSALCLFSDFPMQLNMALFEFNGRSGYLLKHDVLRRGDKKFDPFCDRIDTVVASTLTIKAGSPPCHQYAPLTLTAPTVCLTQARLELCNINNSRGKWCL